MPGARTRAKPTPPPEPVWEPEVDEAEEFEAEEEFAAADEFDEEYDDVDADEEEFEEEVEEEEPEPAPTRFMSLRERLAAAAAEMDGGGGAARTAPPRPAPAPAPAPRPEKAARPERPARPARPTSTARRPAARAAAPVVEPDEAEEVEEVDEVVEDEAPTTEMPRAAVSEPEPVAASAPRWETTSTMAPPAYTPPAPDYTPPSSGTSTSYSPPPPPTSAPPVTRPAPTSEPKGRGGALKAVLIVLGVAVLAGIALVAILALAGSDEKGVKYSDLKAGDCFNTPEGRFNTVETVDCAEQHDLEVYATIEHPAAKGEAFPGMDELVRYANPLCLAQFRGYAGVPFEQLSLSDKYITPRDSAWEDGARRIVCVVGQSNEEPTNTSIRAAGS